MGSAKEVTPAEKIQHLTNMLKMQDDIKFGKFSSEPVVPKAKRYNKGKIRYGLIPNNPLKYLAEVYTKGAHKYSVYEDENGNKIYGKDIPLSEVSKLKLVEDGADNWRLGQDWLESLESVERHIMAFKNGEDFDPDLGTLHLSNAAWGLFSIMEYITTHPELDSRKIKALRPKKIGLDIDGVLADFATHLMSYTSTQDYKPSHWNDPVVRRSFEFVKNDDDFWLSIPVLTDPIDIPFEPHCYITARSIDVAVTKIWLDKNRFPVAPIYSIGQDQSKVEVAKRSGIDIFVDDNYMNFVELTNAGVFTYLFDQSYNRHYKVGHRRIFDLKGL